MAKGSEINITDSLSTILSTVFISGINIIVAGHILGSALNLKEGGENHFTLKVPLLLKLGVTGDRAIAGFAAFTVSMIIVGVLLSDVAQILFIDRMQATDDKWTAVQSLAASLSVILCLFVGAIKSIVVTIGSWFSTNKEQEKQPTDEERVKNLIGDDNE